MKKWKKSLRQIIVAFLLLNTIGLPIQNSVLANELSPTEEVITEETESATTAEMDTSNSEGVESESVPPSEKEVESTEKSSSETVLKESEVLTDTSDFNFAEKQEFSEEPRSATQQNEGRPSTKAVTTGTFPNGSTATWTFDDATGKLSISGGTLVNPDDSIDKLTGIPVSDITNIVLEDKVFASGSCQILFYKSAAISLDLSNFDTSNVTNMNAMFQQSTAKSLDVSNFDTSNVTVMKQMFFRSAAKSLDVSDFDTSNVTDMSNMFAYSVATSLDVSGFDTSNVTNMASMFAYSATTSLDVSNFDTSNVTDMSNMFRNSAATSLDVSDFDTSNVTDMSNMFRNSAATSLDVSDFDTSKVMNMESMFAYSAITSLDVSNFDTSNVTNMGNMFRESAETSLDVSNFDTSNVTDMSNMFAYSAATSLDLSGFDTSKVTNMSYMFAYSAATSLDLSNFDTSKVTSMREMFAGSAITSPDVSSFNTSNVIDMTNMFAYSAATSLDLSNFDASKVVIMMDMFAGASQLQNIILGSQFQFVNSYGTNAALPNPTPTAKYTGKWQNVGSGTVDKPKGSFIGTAAELMSTYDGSTMADTYVWQPTLLEVNVKDSILMVGDTWNSEDNFLSGLDSVGDPVDVNAITVTGSVDTTQPGVHSVDYSYGGITSTATITVLETMPASWVNFFVDGTNVRAIPGSALSTPEWDLTTGLWDKWNPGTVKVPTDKIPSEPTKQGYVFKGWKDNTGAMVDFNTLDLDLNSQHEFNFYAVFEKVNSTNPSIEPPTKPGEGPNVVSPTAPGSGGNQTPSNGSGLNTGNMTITSQGNTSTTSPATSQESKLAKLGENNSLLLQGFGVLMVLSGVAFFLAKRRKMHS
ncbi:BspA family leucine-rich repeat surface protein [Listeria monocytogenes]|nr:BspA family leucine-rich repeat surface protein [Listeria monocytogenes]